MTKAKIVVNLKKLKLTKEKEKKRLKKPKVKALTMVEKAKGNGKPGISPFGPVSAIDTAPVAIGNSVKGSSARIIQAKNGVTVKSRDFMFPAIGTGAVLTWTLCGGTPITPAVFSDSTLRQYMQMYQKFRWKYLCVHYITSSATTATGDVMFYHQKNRESVFLNQTSTQLLPFVLNDDDTVIGPQWTNHSACLHVTGKWKSTDYGMTSELEMYADGDLFLLSKTSTTDSPGYILFDYEVEFQEQQISPRLLSLPLPRAQWSQFNVAKSATAVVSNSTTFNVPNSGSNLSGTSSTVPAGLASGDVYKIIIDVTNSSPATWIGATVSNLMLVNSPTGFTGFTLQDGTTLYASFDGSAFTFYPNPEAAFNQSAGFIRYGVTATVTFNLQVWMSLIGTVGPINFNPNF
jgi:hypothetical protein